MKTAYATTLCSGDAYLPGVEALGKSLDASGTRVPKVVMVTADVGPGSRIRLASFGWRLHEIDPVEKRPRGVPLFPRYVSAFTKLRVWELEGYDRVVLLDADTIVLRNVDDLFDRPPLAAAPDFFLPDHFNSGVMVVEPSRRTFDRMMSAVAVTPSYDGGDQGFLNGFFDDWYGMPAAHRLPVGYNVPNFIYQFMQAHPGPREELDRTVKIIHYLVQKPWQARSTLTGASAAWWRCYHAAHPDEATTWKGRAHELEDWTFDRLTSLVLD
jgi:hypothetical protein